MFLNRQWHLPLSLRHKSSRKAASSWLGAQLSCSSTGGTAPAPDTFNHNYMGQIVSALSRQRWESCRLPCSALTPSANTRVSSLEQNNTQRKNRLEIASSETLEEFHLCNFTRANRKKTPTNPSKGLTWSLPVSISTRNRNSIIDGSGGWQRGA